MGFSPEKLEKIHRQEEEIMALSQACLSSCVNCFQIAGLCVQRGIEPSQVRRDRDWNRVYRDHLSRIQTLCKQLDRYKRHVSTADPKLWQVIHARDALALAWRKCQACQGQGEFCMALEQLKPCLS